MKADLSGIVPQGIYTGAQAIAATGMCKRTFYNYVKTGRIPSHFRMIDGRRVYKGCDLLDAICNLIPMAPPGWGEARRKRRGKR